MNRRDFIVKTGLAAGGVVAGSAVGGCATTGKMTTSPQVSGNFVAIVADPTDPIAAMTPARWAVQNLKNTLAARGFEVAVVDKLDEAPAGARCIIAAGRNSPLARDAGALAANEPEALALAAGQLGQRQVLAAAGADGRGLMYALTDIADAVAEGNLPESTLPQNPGELSLSERPANKVRSIMRMFVTDVEDKAWYNDRAFWRSYLTMLATNRFNRVNLAFGLGYDAPSGIRDSYLYFAYPFLLSVPGYDVRATNLPDAERDANFAMLRFISDEAAARGLQFQLGLWTHAYQLTNSPNANHIITGLTPQTQAPYSRDALAIILKECPNITGVTFRIHGESGVPEGSYDLWRTIFDGLTRSGRQVELDMHAKGMDQPTIDAALDSGMPVVISPKFWAEHMGLPYHQAAIRQTEQPRTARGGGAFAQSNGARSFLRYGYGDLLTEDRKYGILHRIWPGTQRVLLWGDPVFASSYSRAGSFCGSLGHELMEPLSFKGRKGSGLPGGRDGYADVSLRAQGGDFEKYRYTYRLWGRMLYNPNTDLSACDRQLRREFGRGSGQVELSLAHASRILPLITTAHLPAAANNNNWPEMYVNMSIVDAARVDTQTPTPYGSSETPSPRRFGTVSPLDPQLFSRVDDYAGELLNGPASVKYTPIEVAQWLEDLAQSAFAAYDAARDGVPDRSDPAFRRYAVDVQIQIGLGRFFGKKFRAALLYALYEHTGAPPLALAALTNYREARRIWAEFAELAGVAYVKDLTYGIDWFQRGNWGDRLAAIDLDLAAMQQRTPPAPTSPNLPAETIAALLRTAEGRPTPRPAPNVVLVAPPPFRRGQPVTMTLAKAGDVLPKSARLYYRHTNQAEAWRTLDMTADTAGAFNATIPGEYTDSPYALIFYFELDRGTDRPAMYPGFNSVLGNEPYFVLRQAQV